MRYSEYTTVKDHLLSAAMVLSPTGKEQKAFVQMLNDTLTSWSGEDQYIEVVKALLGGMLDGLRYGNWPGTFEACETCGSTTGSHTEDECFK